MHYIVFKKKELTRFNNDFMLKKIYTNKQAIIFAERFVGILEKSFLF